MVHLCWQRMKDHTMVDVRIKRILQESIRALHMIQGNQKFQYVSLENKGLTGCERLHLLWFGRNVI